MKAVFPGLGFMLCLTACASTAVTPAPIPAPIISAEAATWESVSRAPSSIDASEFQTRKDDTEFATFTNGLDLNEAKYVFKYKNTGTSVGVKLSLNGESIGKWVPENSATNVEAQVVSYYIGRFVNMSRIIVPSAYYQANGRLIREFKTMLENAAEKNKWRIINRDSSLNALRKNPETMLGVLTADVKNAEVEELVNDSANTINRNHPIAQFISAEGPMPSDTKMMSFKYVVTKDKRVPKNTELQLAREFSQIMVLDILCGQWDRFSGGNVEATWDKEAVLHMISRDNGGAALSTSTFVDKYLNIVSRFDRAQIDRVKKLGQLLAEDPEGTAKSLKMYTKPKALQGRIATLLAQIEALRGLHGDAAVFFP